MLKENNPEIGKDNQAQNSFLGTAKLGKKLLDNTLKPNPGKLLKF
jgi:hypothetical protein